MADPQPPLFDALRGHARAAVALTGADVDAGLPILEATPAFAALVGVAPGAAIGRPLLGLVSPRTPSAEVARIHAAVRGGTAVLGEPALLRADGTVVWVEADLAPLPGRAGAGGRVVAVLRDVTERRRTERALARAGQVLSSATAAGGVGIWEWDPETDAVVWNATLRRILGVAEDEPADVERWFALTHPEDRPVARRVAADRLAGGEARYRIVRPDGEVRHILVHGGGPADQDADGHLFGTVVDVTERRSAATRVAETLESITDAYFALDRSWRFTYVNRHAEELMRAAREDLLGRELWECFPAVVGTPFERGYRTALDEQRTVTFEAHYAPFASWFEVRAYPVPDGIAVSFRNIDARRAAEAERERLLADMHHQATHDSLTGLTTRDELVARLDAALAAGHAVSVLFVDVDRFKLVNDSLGHAVGDGLLRLLAERLRSLTRSEDVVARIGGDEFVVGLVDTARAVVQSVAERVLDAARTPARVASHVLVMSASIGISEAAAGGDAAALLRDADVALYRAKDAGRDQAVWFDERARTDLLERVQIERDLRAAVAGDELALHFQPGFDLRTGRRAGAEALVRWRHPRRGLVPPDRFIPVAEDSGLIAGVGEWVLAAAARAAAGWPAGAAGATVWANVSARQLARPGLAATIRRVLDEAGLRPASLGIEVTESAVGEHEDVVGELLRVADLGVRIALDDFGTGYSSIARLRALPVDLLKIDRSFVAALGEPGGVATVAAIVDLGHALGKTVIAEGVESEEQLAALRRTGCDEVAGFLLARPVPPAELPSAAGAGEERLGGPGLRVAL